MAVPANFAAVQGQTVISADNLNSVIQTVYNYAALRAFSSAVANQVVYCMGTSTPGDGGQAHYYWSPTATGPDNGETIIMPTGNTVGAWVAFYPLPTWARFGAYLASWTPTTVQAQSSAAGNPIVTVPPSAYTFTGYYAYLGLKTIHVAFDITLGDMTGYTGVLWFALPPVGTPNTWSVGALRENAHTGVMGYALFSSGDTSAAVVRYDGQSLVTTGFTLIGNVIYTIA